MKFSELEELVRNYQSVQFIPSRLGVMFGCDCGCGGDLYTLEEWNYHESEAQKDIDKMKEWCYNNNIEWDVDE